MRYIVLNDFALGQLFFMARPHFEALTPWRRNQVIAVGATDTVKEAARIVHRESNARQLRAAECQLERFLNMVVGVKPHGDQSRVARAG